MRILLVESDDLIRGLIVDSLKGLGHRITAIKSAPDALNVLQASDFDLLLTAYFLPMMNGLDLARKAREHDPKIRVALVTGYRRDIVSDAVRDGLVDLVIREPFQTSGFTESITELLDRSS